MEPTRGQRSLAKGFFVDLPACGDAVGDGTQEREREIHRDQSIDGWIATWVERERRARETERERGEA